MREKNTRENSHIVESVSAPNLGRRIRDERTKQGLTLDALAEQADVSRATISKIERGEINPTLIVVCKIALALRVSISRLSGVEEKQRAIKIPKSRRMTLRDEERGYEQQIFPAFAGGELEFVFQSLLEGGSSGEWAAHRHGSERWVFVQKGSLLVRLGVEEYHLDEGDAFYFAADVTHCFENAGVGICHWFVVSRGE